MSVWVSVMSLLSSVSHGFIFKMGSKKCRGLHIIGEDYVFFDCGAVFDLPAYFYPGHVTLFCHLTRNQHVYQNQKKEAGNFIKENLGCGAIQNTRFVAQLNIFPLYIETRQVKTPIKFIFNRKITSKL